MSCIRPLVIYQVKIPLVRISCRLALQPETWEDGEIIKTEQPVPQIDDRQYLVERPD